VNFTTITALFRAYDSWEDSINDHTALLTGAARYRDVVGELDYKDACTAIKAAGYATDPAYTSKLIQLIERYDLTDYDSIEGMKLTPAPAGFLNVVISGQLYRPAVRNTAGHFYILLEGLGGLTIKLRDALNLAGYSVAWDGATATATVTATPLE
jgi:hypothetical protein